MLLLLAAVWVISMFSHMLLLIVEYLPRRYFIEGWAIGYIQTNLASGYKIIRNFGNDDNGGTYFPPQLDMRDRRSDCATGETRGKNHQT